jgi:hypothetical protein
MVRQRVAGLLIAATVLAVSACGSTSPSASSGPARCKSHENDNPLARDEAEAEERFRAAIGLPTDAATVARALAETKARKIAGATGALDMPLTDDERGLVSAQQQANEYVSSISRSPEADNIGLSMAYLTRATLSPVLVVRSTAGADPRTAKGLAAAVQERFGVKLASIDSCTVSVPASQLERVSDLLIADDTRRMVGQAVGARVASESFNIETFVVGYRIEFSAESERNVTDRAKVAAAEDAIKSITGYDLAVDLTTEPLPKVPWAGHADASASATSVKRGESLTITPTKVVGRECGGGLVFYRVLDRSQVELVGRKRNDNWSTPPMTILACAPPASDLPETVVVPDIGAGAYVVCISGVGEPAGCARLAVLA